MKLINKLSIVVSVYNEEAVLDKFYETMDWSKDEDKN